MAPKRKVKAKVEKKSPKKKPVEPKAVKKERKTKAGSRNRVQAKTVNAAVEEDALTGQGFEEEVPRISQRLRGKRIKAEVDPISLETDVSSKKRRKAEKPTPPKRTRKSKLKIESLVNSGRRGLPASDLQEQKVSKSNKTSLVGPVHQDIKREDEELSDKMVSCLVSTNPEPIHRSERMPDENSDVRLFSTSSFAMKYVKPSGEVVKTVLDNPVSCFIRNTIMERTDLFGSTVEIHSPGLQRLHNENEVMKAFIDKYNSLYQDKDNMINTLRRQNLDTLNVLADERARFCIDWRDRDAKRLVEETKRSAEEQNFYLKEKVHSTVDNLKTQYDSQLKELDEDRKKLAAENDSIHRRNERQKRLVNELKKENAAYYKSRKLSSKYFSLVEWMLVRLAQEIKKLDQTVRTGFDSKMSEFGTCLKDSLIVTGCDKMDFELTDADTTELMKLFERMKSKVKQKVRPADIKTFIKNVENQTHHEYLSDNEFTDVKPLLVRVKREPTFTNETEVTQVSLTGTKDLENEFSSTASVECESWRAKCAKGEDSSATEIPDESGSTELAKLPGYVKLAKTIQDELIDSSSQGVEVESTDINSLQDDPDYLVFLQDEFNGLNYMDNQTSDPNDAKYKSSCLDVLQGDHKSDLMKDMQDELSNQTTNREDRFSGFNGEKDLESTPIDINQNESNGVQCMEFIVMNDIQNKSIELNCIQNGESRLLPDQSSCADETSLKVVNDLQVANESSMRGKEDKSSSKVPKIDGSGDMIENEPGSMSLNMPDLSSTDIAENALEMHPSTISEEDLNAGIERSKGKESEVPFKVFESGMIEIKAREREIKAGGCEVSKLSETRDFVKKAVDNTEVNDDKNETGNVIHDLDLSESDDDLSDTYNTVEDASDDSVECDQETLLEKAKELKLITDQDLTRKVPVRDISVTSPQEVSERKLTAASCLRASSTWVEDIRLNRKQNVNLQEIPKTPRTLSNRTSTLATPYRTRDHSSAKTGNCNSKLSTAHGASTSVKSRLNNICGSIIPVNQTLNMCQKKRFEESAKKRQAEKLQEKSFLAKTNSRLSGNEESSLSTTDSGSEFPLQIRTNRKVETSGCQTSAYVRSKMANIESVPYSGSSAVTNVSRKSSLRPIQLKETKNIRQLLKKRRESGKCIKSSDAYPASSSKLRYQDIKGSSTQVKDKRAVKTVSAQAWPELGNRSISKPDQAKSRSSATLRSEMLQSKGVDAAKTLPQGIDLNSKMNNAMAFSYPNIQNQPSPLQPPNNQLGMSQGNFTPGVHNAMAFPFPNSSNQPFQIPPDFFEAVTRNVMNTMFQMFNSNANTSQNPFTPTPTTPSETSSTPILVPTSQPPLVSHMKAICDSEVDRLTTYDSPMSPTALKPQCSDDFKSTKRKFHDKDRNRMLDDEKLHRMFLDEEWKFLKTPSSCNIMAWCTRYINYVVDEFENDGYSKSKQPNNTFLEQLEHIGGTSRNYVYIGLASCIYEIILQKKATDLFDRDNPLKNDYVKMGEIIRKISERPLGIHNFSKLPELLFEYFETQIIPNRSTNFGNEDITLNKLGRFYGYLSKQFKLDNRAVELLLQAVYYRPHQAFSLAAAMFKIHMPFNPMSGFDSLSLKLRCVLYCLLAPQRFQDSLGLMKLRGLLSSIKFKIPNQPYQQFIEGVVSELKAIESSAALKEGCKCLGALFLQQKPEKNIRFVGESLSAVTDDWRKGLINDGVFAHLITGIGEVFLTSPDEISKDCLYSVQSIFDTLKNGTQDSKFVNDAAKEALTSISLRLKNPRGDKFNMAYVKCYQYSKRENDGKQKKFKKYRRGSSHSSSVSTKSTSKKQD